MRESMVAYTRDPISSTVPGVNQLQIRQDGLSWNGMQQYVINSNHGSGCSTLMDIYSFQLQNPCVWQLPFSYIKMALELSYLIISVTPGVWKPQISPDILLHRYFYYRPHLLLQARM